MKDNNTMKILVATEKPFAAAAVNGIKKSAEAEGHEVVLLEKYTDKQQLLDAVKDADKMVAFERGTVNGRYACKTKLLPLTEVANAEKKVPQEWINAEGNGVTHDFIDYALPLIQGETKLEKEDGLPRFARLKKVFAK